MRAPCSLRERARAPPGDVRRAGDCAAGSRSACEVSQFWQYPQW